MASECLRDSDGWVLDPFGAAPLSVLEAAQAGRKVLVTAANPLLVFILETLAAAPRPQDFQAALAALSTARRGEDRLEAHIRGLYRTPCAGCGEEVEAEAFLWRRGDAAPYARIYRCPRCREEGERPTAPQDTERLAPPGSDALHRARALARVAAREDEHYTAVEEALGAYLPRPLYALQTLINKVEGPGFTPAQRHLLQALLLSACDAGSTLWALGGRARPRQLATPSQFRENNIWLALEQAAAEWGGQTKVVPLVKVGDASELVQAAGRLPPSGGILLFAGRARGLAVLPEEICPRVGLVVFPRPNQAFWTLSALWAGWLWGREAALPLHPLLGRQRYDWNWHARALHSPLSAAARLLPGGAALTGLLSELVPGFLAAVLAACSASGLKLSGLALRADEEQAQITWRVSGGEKTSPSAPGLPREAERIFAGGVRRLLDERAEPSDYLPVYAAGLESLANEDALPGPLPEREQLPGDLLTRVQALAGRVFSDRKILRRYETGSQEDERSLWWLADAAPGLGQLALEAPRVEMPLADRVEMELVRMLQKSPGQRQAELDTALCRVFPGLSTPPAELIAAILESYGEVQDGRWKLQSAELPAARRSDLEEARAMLRGLGERLGYTVAGETPLLWTPGRFGQVYYFYVIASSVISRHVLPALPAPAGQVVMVFPGGRARLIAYKLRRDPRLREALKGVHLLKFRHLRALSERTGLTVEQWEGLLDADPPFFEEAEQMRLL
jgi:hypothetical protein